MTVGDAMNLKRQLFRRHSGEEPSFDQVQIAWLARRLSTRSRYSINGQSFQPSSPPVALRRDPLDNRMFKRTVYKDLFVQCSYD